MTDIKQHTCSGIHGKVDTIQMCEVLRVADPLMLKKPIASTECLLVIEMFSGRHSKLPSELLKPTEINDLYFSGNRIGPLGPAFTDVLCLKSCEHTFCSSEVNSLKQCTSTERSASRCLCCSWFARASLCRGSFHPFSKRHNKAATTGTRHIPPGKWTQNTLMHFRGDAFCWPS